MIRFRKEGSDPDPSGLVAARVTLGKFRQLGLTFPCVDQRFPGWDEQCGSPILSLCDFMGRVAARP